MRKFLSLIVGLFLLVAATALADGSFYTGSTNNGRYTDLKVLGGGGSTARTGLKAIIDLNNIAQADSTLSTTAVLGLNQSATTAPMLAFTCTAGTTNSCPCYTTTSSAKAGSIKIYVNGAARYINFYNTQQ